MQNHFGDPVVETFFLVLPAQLKIVRQDEDYSSKETVCEYDVYYWSKELPKDTNHKVGIVLAKTDGSESSVQTAEELTDEGWKLWGKQKFSESAEFFRKAMAKEPWSQSLNAVRKPLGAVKERKVLSSTFTTQAPGAPDGKYVVIQFQIVCEQGVGGGDGDADAGFGRRVAGVGILYQMPLRGRIEGRSCLVRSI